MNQEQETDQPVPPHGGVDCSSQSPPPPPPTLLFLLCHPILQAYPPSPPLPPCRFGPPKFQAHLTTTPMA
eukprot:767946-Hanusia_phi.AAC.1